MAKYTLTHFASERDFVEHAVAEFKHLCSEAITARGKFCVALSGGNTPKIFYEALAAAQIDWSKIHLYFSDERYVSHSDPLSNYGMVQKCLLSHIQIPAANIHGIKVGLVDPHEAARLYEQELSGGKLDLIYLGIGADGHTASIFPGILSPERQKVAAIFVAKTAGYRVTLLPDLINDAREIRFLVSGANKKQILDYITTADPEAPNKYPCQQIRSCEILYF